MNIDSLMGLLSAHMSIMHDARTPHCTSHFTCCVACLQLIVHK